MHCARGLRSRGHELSEQDFGSKLQELINSIKGLSMEVEGLRLNNNSNCDFILVALKDMLTSANKLQAQIK